LAQNTLGALLEDRTHCALVGGWSVGGVSGQLRE
jgi:hypothetical protein